MDYELRFLEIDGESVAVLVPATEEGFEDSVSPEGYFTFSGWRPLDKLEEEPDEVKVFEEFDEETGEVVEVEKGRLFQDVAPNLVPNVMEDHYLDVALNGAAQSSTWYVGLTDSTPTTAESDTMSSHAGWTENQAYSESNRVTWSSGAVSGQSIDNSGSVASFSINAATTIGGAFLTDDNTKGGTSGVLGAVSANPNGDRSLQNGDTFEVTYTMTMGGS